MMMMMVIMMERGVIVMMIRINHLDRLTTTCRRMTQLLIQRRALCVQF